MIETISQLASFNLISCKGEKYSSWTAVIAFISCIGAYAIIGQIIPGAF